ncbi:glucose-6-phosphate 1-dehydrogenase [Buchnera aphidicola str. Bp (Baizongia pistaciae)]|uniref:Glucose-6-phosphate 1-dehydrogenase n=1 Tax=Buchnera aphidicola subsp. Baizongia pistaciae (strain Bp) TaxID=224915 RepID=G6PD_BUCBP|nr:glucose-6-phosphate dehydrogenase [Buchnera aphidicola]Q89AI7.1 RecName: Full=Glucose-6-phosphate 1-dehydrogenase; Short=G6PD [Buchnera aphidicola str. Bp (Baizongia pistaciae)]AAO27023.1 glucose-6-phosphate 1-dehydrogenase [Buchnera aphidicola str. Bp (Baizongia pistaciae)]
MKNKNSGYDLVIFGAKGDLSCRKLLPSLYQLEKKNKLCTHTRIIGVGRANWDKIIYTNVVYKSLIKFLNETIIESIWKKFSSRLEFCNLDINCLHNFKKLKQIIQQNNNIIINYLAMPPHTFGNICLGLESINLNLEPTRIIIEKPLGSSLKTSININNKIGKFFKEKQIFRIDHYLGKETIQNLLAFRFSNSLFYYNWNNKFIDHVQITVSETIGVEGRFNYFDTVGQIKDMVQNHLLQILTITTMSTPIDCHENSIRDEKVKILKSLRPFNINNIHKNVILGQYTSGIINQKKVKSYLDETNNQEYQMNKYTETFVSMKIYIDNDQWSGVPFYLRTGKRLPKKCSEIVIFFKTPPLNIFSKNYNTLSKNKLILSLQPNEAIKIYILNKKPKLTSQYKLDLITLDFNYSKFYKKIQLSDAYEKLLLESMKGIQSLFVRRDEVELAWKWIDSTLQCLHLKPRLPDLYPAGTWGPARSKTMINNDGYEWNE